MVQTTIELTWQRAQRPLESGDNDAESTQKAELLRTQKDCKHICVSFALYSFSQGMKTENTPNLYDKLTYINDTLGLCHFFYQSHDENIVGEKINSNQSIHKQSQYFV